MSGRYAVVLTHDGRIQRPNDPALRFRRLAAAIKERDRQAATSPHRVETDADLLRGYYWRGNPEYRMRYCWRVWDHTRRAYADGDER